MSLKNIYGLMDITDRLKAAVAAKQAYWQASVELEAALGFPNDEVPDRVSDIITTEIENLATGPADAAQVDHTHAQYLVGEVLDELRGSDDCDEAYNNLKELLK